MTAQAFYRRSIALPFVCMLPAFALGPVSKWAVQGPILRFIVQLPATLLFAGLFAAVPYLIFILVVWKFFRPETEAAHRRVAIIAPAVVALEFILATMILESVTTSWSNEDAAFTIVVPGALALGFGYFYVGLLELALAISKRVGWVVSPRKP